LVRLDTGSTCFVISFLVERVAFDFFPGCVLTYLTARPISSVGMHRFMRHTRRPGFLGGPPPFVFLRIPVFLRRFSCPFSAVLPVLFFFPLPIDTRRCADQDAAAFPFFDLHQGHFQLSFFFVRPLLPFRCTAPRCSCTPFFAAAPAQPTPLRPSSFQPVDLFFLFSRKRAVIPRESFFSRFYIFRSL